MNNTLNNYIKRSEEILAVKGTYSNITQRSKKKNVNEFKNMISNLEITLQQVKDNYQKYTSSSPNTSGITTNQNHNSLMLKNAINTSIYTIPTKYGLIWIPEINQYSIQINDIILRGNVGNIYDKRMLRNEGVKAHQVMICKKGNGCENILSNQYCKFWHDPVELLNLKNNKIITDEFYNTTIKYTRNFSNTSWIYTSDKRTIPRNMRCIGSKDMLNNDIALFKASKNVYMNQIQDFKHQVMHDILVLCMLYENNLV